MCMHAVCFSLVFPLFVLVFVCDLIMSLWLVLFCQWAEEEVDLSDQDAVEPGLHWWQHWLQLQAHLMHLVIYLFYDFFYIVKLCLYFFKTNIDAVMQSALKLKEKQATCIYVSKISVAAYLCKTDILSRADASEDLNMRTCHNKVFTFQLIYYVALCSTGCFECFPHPAPWQPALSSVTTHTWGTHLISWGQLGQQPWMLICDPQEVIVIYI